MGNHNMDYGHWQLSIGEFDPDDYAGFVYRITRKDTHRQYIGRKVFHSTTRRKVAGRKNRKVVKKDSGWKEYTSSCDELNEEILKFGKDEFIFEIIFVGKTKRDINYVETALQFKEDVLNSLLEDGSRSYYNSNIMNRWYA
tara:strand:+ start:593 stop:1015 length:423 start_codon:yes stop_codon:yes gene_type:complete